MLTLDLKQTLKPYYTAAVGKPALIEVPSLPYLKVDGSGNPNTAPDYAAAVQGLYSLAYTAKFMLKKRGELDFNVMALQGLWWADDMLAFLEGRKDDWRWTMMIVMPEALTQAHIEEARAQAAKKTDPAVLARIRLEPYAEGLAAQVMHLGPYSAEAPTIAALHAFIAAQGCERSGLHHEIYLGDPRRTAPEKLRTIIRQPCRRLA